MAEFFRNDFPAPPPGFGTGLIPRDFSQCPVGSLFGSSAFSKEISLIPRDEWPDRIADQIGTKSRISDIRNTGNKGKPIPALDQGSVGYCWSYSVVACIQLCRAIANQPYVPLSGHSVACDIKNFRDEGGWCGLSCEYIIDSGVVPQSHWPAKSMDRKYDTTENWEVAKEYRILEGFLDLDAAAYDYQLTFDQFATCLLSGIPCVGDYNHWGHSVCVMDLVEVDARKSLTDINRWGVRDLNSWSDRHGDNGTDILVGRKAVPDGALAVRSVVG